jgi:hypothetical protein
MEAPRTLHPIRARPTFFVRAPAGATLPAPPELLRHLHRWIMRELSGWLQLAVLELLDDGSMEWSIDATANPSSGARVISVRCVDIPGPRRPGLWAALSVAHALAELLGGCVVDPRRSAASLSEASPPPEGPSRRSGARARLRAPADGRVRTIHHLCVPCSRGRDRDHWLSSVGMAHFGLPDLELVDVPEPEVERAARLLLGVAQHVIESAWIPPREGTREVLLTVGELHWALGGEANAVPISTGRGWTRVALGFDRDRAWPLRREGPYGGGEALGQLLRLGPPSGTRQWRDSGAWLRDAWADLFGRGASVLSAEQR